MKQHYNAYTDEDRLVWSTLFERQINNLRERGSADFFKALETVGFSAGKIPDFNELDQVLKGTTGWSMEVVPSIIPQAEFFQLLSQKKFPATTWLRRLDQLDYLEEPDIFHDVFGHVPLLSNQAYTDFFSGIAGMALNYLDNPKAIELLGRIYWFTIEFGLIREGGNLKVYGAGIMSSSGETIYSLGNKAEHLPFDVERIMNTEFRTDVFQEKYFVIDSFVALFQSLPEVERVLKKNLALQIA